MLRAGTMRTEIVAQSVAELLMAIDSAGLASVTEELGVYLDDPLTERRALATAVLVRSGRPLKELAARDRDALLGAVSTMTAEQLPASAVEDLKLMVEDGTVDTATGIVEVARLSTDRQGLFAWLASLIDPARGVGFDQWSPDHERAMAALRGMHTVGFSDWPSGYDDYAVPPADPEVYAEGARLYHLAEEGCVKCHGEHGEGVEGFPPLANSPWVLGNPRRAAAIVAHGLTGELTLPDGSVFNATMDPVQKGSLFSDADVAAILTYVRQSFGNYTAAVSFEDVKYAPVPEDRGSWKTHDLLMVFPLSYDRLLGAADAPAGPGIASWSPPRGGLLLMLVGVFALNALLGAATYLANR